jgi:hypothetical protein
MIGHQILPEEFTLIIIEPFSMCTVVRLYMCAMCLSLVGHSTILRGPVCLSTVVVCRHFQHLLLLSYLDVQWHTSFSWLHTASRWLFDATGSGAVSVDCLLPAGGLPVPRSFASKLITLLLPLGVLLLVIGAAMYMRQRWVHFGVWECHIAHN